MKNAGVVALPRVDSLRLAHLRSSRKLGPGTYLGTQSTLGGPQFGFTRSTRFDQAEPTLVRSNSDFIQRNKQVQRYLPSRKATTLFRNSLLTEQRIRCAKFQKQLKLREKLTRLRNHIHQKTRIHQCREQRPQLEGVVRAWVTLLSLTTVCTALKNSVQHKQLRSQRLRLHSVVFWTGARMLGRLSLTLRRFREKKRQRGLTKLCEYVKPWKMQICKRFQERVNGTVSQWQGDSLLGLLIYSWCSRIVQIQRAWRQCLFQKRAYLRLRRKAWVLNEAAEQPKVPGAVKDYFMRRLLRNRVKDYHSRVSAYNRHAAYMQRSFHILSVILPERPKPYYHVTRQDYTLLRQQALQVRTSWLRLMNRQHG